MCIRDSFQHVAILIPLQRKRSRFIFPTDAIKVQQMRKSLLTRMPKGRAIQVRFAIRSDSMRRQFQPALEANLRLSLRSEKLRGSTHFKSFPNDCSPMLRFESGDIQHQIEGFRVLPKPSAPLFPKICIHFPQNRFRSGTFQTFRDHDVSHTTLL